MTEIVCFPPEVTPETSILVLGSMPGETSLLHQQYYAHPRNSFWPIMAALFGFDVAENYSRRLRILKDNKIGLWDVLGSCIRKGSLDSDIKQESVRVNDFSTLFLSCPSLQYVFFNGRKAQELFSKRVDSRLIVDSRLTTFYLPSTSPAHAALNFEAKLASWKKAFDVAC